MNIHDKIDEIRRKPEHIRMRYVWFFVGISMFFVIALWIISFKVSKKETPSETTKSNLFDSDIIDQFSEQKKSLDDTRGKVQDSFSSLGKMVPSSPQSEEQNNQNEIDLENGTGQ